MARLSNRSSTALLAAGVVAAVGLKLWLVESQDLIAHGSALLDERLYLDLATHLARGEWLGPYNNGTLAKSPLYPIWIALCHQLHLPLLLAQHLLHALACGALVLALAAGVRSRLLLTGIFLLLLFDPRIYDAHALRVVRSGIYPALTFFVFAGMIGALLRLEVSKRVLTGWLMLWGLSLAALWLTREEGIWILPSSLWVLAFAAVAVYRLDLPDRLVRLALLALPLLLLSLGVKTTETLNQRVYRIPVVVELKATPFERAYGALTRVLPERRNLQVPVSVEARRRIYPHSPAMASLRPHLEGWLGRRWSTIGRPVDAPPDDGEIYGTSFYWALRDASAQAGHHATASLAMSHYDRIADEVDAACAAGALPCEAAWNSLIPRWRNAYLPLLAQRLAKGVVEVATLDGLEPDPWRRGFQLGFDAESAALFGGFTREKVVGAGPPGGGVRLRVLRWLTSAYRVVFPLFCAAALFAPLAALARGVARRSIGSLAVVATALLGGVAVRSLALSYQSVAGAEVMNHLYLGPVYGLVILAAWVGVLALRSEPASTEP